jgi:uncharacterized protein (UPF0332 family)
MTEEEKALIAYRMERAHEAVEEAKVLFDAGHLNAYVNRLYYACFYVVSALLLTKDISTSKHGYLRSLMHREFVKTGLIPKELGKHFDMLFDSRLEGDYADLVRFKADDVSSWLEETEKFVTHAESLIPKLTQ